MILLMLNVGNGLEWGVAGIIIDSYILWIIPHSLRLSPVSDIHDISSGYLT